jgi:hypothetical protein
MNEHVGQTHPLLLALDGGIYVLEGQTIHGGHEYVFEHVVLAALRELSEGRGCIEEIERLMTRIVSPDTPDEDAYRIWHDNALMNVFHDVEGTRWFAQLVLDAIAANPDLRRDR